MDKKSSVNKTRTRSIIHKIFGVYPSDINVKVSSDISTFNTEVFKIKRTDGRYYSGTNKNTQRPIIRTKLDFESQEYELVDISVLYDTEAYFRQYVEKIIQRMFKFEYKFIGDEELVYYIRRRIEYMELTMDRRFSDFIEDIARNMIKYYNVFIEKIRNKKIDRRWWRVDEHGRQIPPVINYELHDPPLMRIAVAENGRPLKYLQALERRVNDGYVYTYKNDQRYPTWNPEDMIHISLAKKPNHSYGTPIIGPVIDDIKALRTEEEAGEIIVYQFAKPILVYTLGKEGGRRVGNDDVQWAKDVLNGMSSAGYIILQGEHQVDYVGANNSAINITPYIETMKKRVWEGMGLDSVTMGQGDSSNRSTAQSMTESMIYLVSYYQEKLKRALEWYIFREWLQEANMSGRFEMVFPEIDIDKKHQVEKHALSLYQGNVITFEELRKEIGRRSDINDSDLFMNNVTIPIAQQTKNTEQNTNSSVNSTKQSTSPTNQHGTTTKTKINKG